MQSQQSYFSSFPFVPSFSCAHWTFPGTLTSQKDLNMLATDTCRRGQGVARTFVQWGFNGAATEDTEAELEIGPDALPFYLKTDSVKYILPP